jgi:hypothetical protein
MFPRTRSSAVSIKKSSDDDSKKKRKAQPEILPLPTTPVKKAKSNFTFKKPAASFSPLPTTMTNSNIACEKCTRGLPKCELTISKIQNILSDASIYSQEREKLTAIVSYLVNDCSYVHCNVRQKFGEVFEIGKLIGFNGTYYTALYDDGTYTHLSPAEVKAFLFCY